MPVTVGPVRISGVPSLDNRASTISNGRSDATTFGLNSIVHVNSTISDPSGQIGLDLLLVSVIDSGPGTENMQKIFTVLSKPLLTHILFRVNS